MTSVAVRRLIRRTKNLTYRTSYRLRDRHLSSYGGALSNEPLARLIPSDIRFHLNGADRQAVHHFLAHRFDLLGSGWVRIHHGLAAAGFEGTRYPPDAALDVSSWKRASRIGDSNRATAAAIRKLISTEYQPIDWHIDFKSGFRWSERDWFRSIRFGVAAGADIKVPWELSRMQHLPELALEFSSSKDERLVWEFTDQVLDWIGSNPPRFGVNWVSTMEVGIRVANWCIAFDLLRAAGAAFAPEFLRVFAASVADHANHIARNLEWSETHRANHYLANVAGLLIAAAYLPEGPQSDAWLAFAIQELIAETDRQFLRDGGHFEASTNYHRLCGEMIAVSAVIVRALPELRIRRLFGVNASLMPHGPGLWPRTPAELEAMFAKTGSVLPASFFQRLASAAEFTRDLTRPSGSVPQIGDNDSGRFLRLGGWVREGSVAQCRARYANLETFTDLGDDEDHLVQSPADHQQWLAWAGAALGRWDLPNQEHASVWSHVRTLAEALLAKASPLPVAPPVSATMSTAAQARMSVRVERTRHERRGVLQTAGDLLADLHNKSYPEFGIYIFKSPRLHLVIRCGNAMQDHSGVHAHEDQLSFDLWLDGAHIAADPGTYVYTASTSSRNRYREASSHHAPCVTGPVQITQRGAFTAPRRRLGVCVRFERATFIGTAEIEGGEVTRTLRIFADRMEISDEYQLLPSWTPASQDPFSPAQPVPHSPGYGVRLK
jgi:hypothetical protein